MKVFVVRQPWAWLIATGQKDIENRNWATKYRGPLLIQASANLPAKWDFEECCEFARKKGVKKLPGRDEFEKGGIVGMVQLDDCVTRHRSKWFEGSVGWVLSKPKKLKFTPLKGQLGLFDPPERVLRKLGLKKRSR